jgi:16S rRNA processing protein RimM
VLELGRIAKPHGIKGEVVVEMISDRPERLAAGAVLIAGDRSLVVEVSRPHQGRHIVRFADVPDRNAAEELRGLVLFGEPLDDTDTMWVHELIGSRCVEVSGIDRGEVVAVVDNPAADLLELDSGALVPVSFVVGHADGVITIDPPAGLFE